MIDRVRRKAYDRVWHRVGGRGVTKLRPVVTWFSLARIVVFNQVRLDDEA